MEDLVINSINARQQQLIQEQRTGGLLINLINARHRPYLLVTPTDFSPIHMAIATHLHPSNEPSGLHSTHKNEPSNSQEILLASWNTELYFAPSTRAQVQLRQLQQQRHPQEAPQPNNKYLLLQPAESQSVPKLQPSRPRASPRSRKRLLGRKDRSSPETPKMP